MPTVNGKRNGQVALIDKAIARVRDAVDRFTPCAVVGLFSGGHDSLTANIVAHEAGAKCSLHINTEIGVDETRGFVYETASTHGWRLAEYKASMNINANGDPTPQNYEDIVRLHGFPGPWAHRQMYVRLKERQLEQFERNIGATPERPVLYISGARDDESIRRMGKMRGKLIQRDGRKVWISPIHDFTATDCARCIHTCGFKRNPVVDLIHKSGECLCGAYATRDELDELKMWFPNVAKRIEQLEREVTPKFPWRWGDGGPPKWFREKQQGQEFFEFHGYGIGLETPTNEPLCHRCNLNRRAMPVQRSEPAPTESGFLFQTA